MAETCLFTHSALDVSHEEPNKDVTQAHDAQTLIPNLCQVRFAGQSLGSINSYSGIPVFSPRGQQWLQSRTGETATSEKLCSLGLPWLNPIQPCREYLHLSSHSTGKGMKPVIDLPDKEVVKECAKSYNSSGISLVFPLIEWTLFQETIRLAYDSPQTPYSPYVQCAKASIFAFIAFAYRANVRCSSITDIDIDGCALEALRSMPHIVEGPANLDGLRAILMIVSLTLSVHLSV